MRTQLTSNEDEDFKFNEFAENNTKNCAFNLFNKFIFVFSIMHGQFVCIFGVALMTGSYGMPNSILFYAGPFQMMIFIKPKGELL